METNTKTREEGDQEQASRHDGVLESYLGNRSGSERRQPPYFGVCKFLDGHQRLRGLLYECRSFVYRIQIALHSRDMYLLSTGPVYLESSQGYSYRNIRSRGRIEHIKRIASTLPWATPIDWKTHLESWDQGSGMGCRQPGLWQHSTQ